MVALCVCVCVCVWSSCSGEMHWTNLLPFLSFFPRYLWMTAPSIEALEARLRGRGTETPESLELRLANARKEMAMAATLPFDHSLVNDDPDRAYEKLKAIVNARRDQCQRYRFAQSESKQ